MSCTESTPAINPASIDWCFYVDVLYPCAMAAARIRAVKYGQVPQRVVPSRTIVRIINGMVPVHT